MFASVNGRTLKRRMASRTTAVWRCDASRTSCCIAVATSSTVLRIAADASALYARNLVSLSALLLNKEGVPIGHNAAAKSAAELAADATAQEQLARQKQHDAFLLGTYTSVKDIEQLRDERLLHGW